MPPEERLTLYNEDQPDETAMEIFSTLREYNVARVGDSGHRTLTILLKDIHGVVVGGLRGSTSWGWLHISMFVLKEEVRGQGWGSKMLAAAEEEARRRGCRNAYVDTFSFQARPFYERNGYVVFGALEDYPPGHQCYFVRKRLMPDGDATL